MPDDISAALRVLEAASLIRPGETAGEDEYRFKHTLVQETAYGVLLRERRAELHRAVAEAILRVNPEAGMYQPAVLAFHYSRGGDEERAFRFALRAGNLARRNYAHQEAVANYDLALEVAPRLTSPQLMPQIREAFLGKGTALEISGRHVEAQQVHREMETFGRRTGNAALEAEALIRLATSAVVTSDSEVDVGGMLERAEALARQAGDRLILAKTLWNQGLRDRFRNPLRADEFFSKALEITRSPACVALPPEAGVRETEAHILIDLMVSGLTSGRRKMALQNGGEALAAFRQLGNQPMVADALAGLSNLHFAGGDFESVLRYSEEGSAISTAIENPWGFTYNGWARVQVDADRANWERALSQGQSLLLDAAQVPFIGFRLALSDILTRVWINLGQPARGAECARAIGRLWDEAAYPTEGWHSWVQALQAWSSLSLGDVSGAAAYLEGLRPLPPGVIPGFQNYYFVGPAMAWLDLERGDHARGFEFASDLIDRFDAEGTRRFSAEMHFWRGRMHVARESWPEARRDFEGALERLTDTGARALLWPIHAALADSLEASGDGAAEDHRRTARALIESIAADLRDAALRDSFLSRPEVARLHG
jgi:tetratricopeptide (TPR) repeat protein